MPLDENEMMDQGSSPDPALDGQNANIVAADANSSDATGETGDDLLSVVRDVVTESRKSTEAASPAAAEGEGSEPPEGQSPDEDDFSNVPFNQHPRFKALVTERNRYRTEAQGFRQDAERYQNVQRFVESQGLTPEETADGLIIMGLMKTNPAEALRRMRPALQQLLVAAGEVLPDDLAQRVNAGELSQGVAVELSRERAARASEQAYSRFTQQRDQRHAQQSASTTVQAAASDWQAERMRKDPNFGDKLEPLMDRVYALQRREGVPNTPDGVRDQLNRAYRGLVPAPAAPAVAPAVRKPTTPSSGGQVAGTARPAPKSTMDIIKDRVSRRA